MQCHRCDGLMVRDHVFDPLASESHAVVWRCICCGNILDAVTAANKRGQVGPARRSTRRGGPPMPLPVVTGARGGA